VASAAGRAEDAIDAYRAALAAAPASWSKRAEAVDALVAQLSETKRAAECVELAAVEGPKLASGSALADVLTLGLGCVDDLPKAAFARARVESLITRALQVAGDATAAMLPDDRSGLYEALVHALRAQGSAAEAHAQAQSWATFLEREASQAPTPAARAVFDSHRLLAYIELGQAERALPMLAQSERDLPNDYNPPVRLARANLELRRFPDALAAVDRALSRVYGPRKLRVFALKADILVAAKDKAGARAALGDALAFAKTVTLTSGYPKLRDLLEKRLRDFK
jgi:tetratricopeptide (TPR) repeat protein